MTIYLDIFFVQEFFMNITVIYCTNKILSVPIKFKKILIASIIGSMNTIFCLIYPIQLIAIRRSICIVIIILISCVPKNIYQFIKSALTFYIVTFIFAGIMFYTYNALLKMIIYVVWIAFLVVHFIEEYKQKYQLCNYIYDLEIKIEDKYCKLKVLMDTGNELKSSFKEDVIVLSPRVIQKLKQQELEELLLNGKINEENKYLNLLRFIPFKSLGNNSGFKYGIKIKEAKLKYKNTTYEKSAVIVASDNEFESYDAIIGLNFLES